MLKLISELQLCSFVWDIFHYQFSGTMNKVFAIKLKVSIVLLLLLTALFSYGQADSASKAAQDQDLITKQQQGKNLIAYADSSHRFDSIQLVQIQTQIAELKTLDVEERAVLQARKDSIENAQALNRARIKAQVDSLRGNTTGVPVIFNRDTICFIFANLGPFTPSQRAETIVTKLEKLAENHLFNPADLKIFNGAESADIMSDDLILLSITDRDAFWQDKSRMAVAEQYREHIVMAVKRYREETGFTAVLFRILKVIAVFILLFFGVKYMNRGFTYLNKRLLAYGGRFITGIKISNYELLSDELEKRMLASILKILKWILIAFVIYLSLPVVFSIFPHTEGIARTLIGYVVNPILSFANAFVGYISNLISIAVVLFITNYVVRFLKFLAHEVNAGRLVINGFYSDWALPTYKLIRIVVFAFSFVIIFPLLPGSDSQAFKGVSVFLGILISLGSSSAISNIIAGLVITYMRAFKIGDRVKIGDTVGDVISKTMLVTHVRTIKNEDVTIPNAAILNGSTVNYSSSANDLGLILNTTVTIGYDVPWKQVHDLLIGAALKTSRVEKEPSPFVLQTSLDDFYVSYQINAITREAGFAAKIYSELHANIQDAFNEAGVEILSPHYRAARDGNAMAIPSSYLPPDYKAPGFGVKVENQGE